MRSTSTLRSGTCPFAAGIERTFGFSPTVPRARRSLVYALAGLAVLATGAAAAAWQVHDRDTHRQVQALRESVGGNSSNTAVGELQKINTRLRVDHKPAQLTTAIVAEPAGTAKIQRDVAEHSADHDRQDVSRRGAEHPRPATATAVS